MKLRLWHPEMFMSDDEIAEEYEADTQWALDQIKQFGTLHHQATMMKPHANVGQFTSDSSHINHWIDSIEKLTPSRSGYDPPSPPEPPYVPPDLPPPNRQLDHDQWTYLITSGLAESITGRIHFPPTDPLYRYWEKKDD